MAWRSVRAKVDAFRVFHSERRCPAKFAAVARVFKPEHAQPRGSGSDVDVVSSEHVLRPMRQLTDSRRLRRTPLQLAQIVDSLGRCHQECPRSTRGIAAAHLGDTVHCVAPSFDHPDELHARSVAAAVRRDLARAVVPRGLLECSVKDALKQALPLLGDHPVRSFARLCTRPWNSWPSSAVAHGRQGLATSSRTGR